MHAELNRFARAEHAAVFGEQKARFSQWCIRISPLRQSPATSIRSIVFETILSQSLLL
jgi:hypothetical protein